MHKNDFKDQTYHIISSIAKAMGNPHRLEILELLSNGKKSVEIIARETRMTLGNASQHLQRLKQYNLVNDQRRATTIYYSLADDSVLKLIKSLHQTAHSQLPQVTGIIADFRKQYGTDKYAVNRLPDDNYLLVDVRSKDEFMFGHHKGAINIPHFLITKSLNKLDKNKLIITYCRGELCTLADEVVKQLNDAGYNAVRLEEFVISRTA